MSTIFQRNLLPVLRNMIINVTTNALTLVQISKHKRVEHVADKRNILLDCSESEIFPLEFFFQGPT